MKFVSKMIMAVAVLATSAPLWAGQPATPACPTSFADDSWTSLDSGLGTCYGLPEGTYRGKGRHTRHTYILHLMRYLRRDDAFLAVSQDKDTGHSAIGFLVRKGQGNYSWYGVKISKDAGTNYDFIDIPLNQAPLFNFMLEPDLKGRVTRISAVSENATAQVEAIDFTDVRAPLIHRSLLLGRWCRNHNSLSVMPGESTNEMNSSAPSATWLSKLQLETANGTSQSSFLIREETVPGLFVMRKYEQEGYVRRTSPQISYIAVTVDRKKSYGLFETTEPDVLIFSTDANGFLTANPLNFAHED